MSIPISRDDLSESCASLCHIKEEGEQSPSCLSFDKEPLDHAAHDNKDAQGYLSFWSTLTSACDTVKAGVESIKLSFDSLLFHHDQQNVIDHILLLSEDSPPHSLRIDQFPSYSENYQQYQEKITNIFSFQGARLEAHLQIDLIVMDSPAKSFRQIYHDWCREARYSMNRRPIPLFQDIRGIIHPENREELESFIKKMIDEECRDKISMDVYQRFLSCFHHGALSSLDKFACLVFNRFFCVRDSELLEFKEFLTEKYQIDDFKKILSHEPFAAKGIRCWHMDQRYPKEYNFSFAGDDEAAVEIVCHLCLELNEKKNFRFTVEIDVVRGFHKLILEDVTSSLI
jgi:hypothetical protein